MDDEISFDDSLEDEEDDLELTDIEEIGDEDFDDGIEDEELEEALDEELEPVE